MYVVNQAFGVKLIDYSSHSDSDDYMSCKSEQVKNEAQQSIRAVRTIKLLRKGKRFANSVKEAEEAKPSTITKLRLDAKVAVRNVTLISMGAYYRIQKTLQ